MFLFILGLITGSFLNVLIHRLPRGESIVFPPSHCPHCQHRLNIPDLVPAISYLCLRGRCRYCKSPIRQRYLFVELLTGSLTAWWSVQYSPNPRGVAVLIFVYLLIAIAFIDLEHKIIPNKLTYPAIILGLLFQWWQGMLIPALVGGLVSGGMLLLVLLVYPKGMGMGDVKYLTMAGVFLGWEKALFSLFLGSTVGTLIMIPMILIKKLDRKAPIPFGPFLVTGALILVFWQDLFQFIYNLYV